MNDDEKVMLSSGPEGAPAGRGRPTWTDLRKKLARADLEYVIGIVKMVYDLSKENQAFLISRLFPNTDWSEMRERHRKRIVNEFHTPSGLPRNPKLSVARKAIGDYRKATSDLAGAAELMLTYVEEGTEFGAQYGVQDYPFYRSLETVFDELVRILERDEQQSLIEHFRERLRGVVDEATDCVGGYDEFVSERVADLGIMDDEEEETPGPTGG